MARARQDAPSGGGEPLNSRVADTPARAGEKKGFAVWHVSCPMKGARRGVLLGDISVRSTRHNAAEVKLPSFRLSPNPAAENSGARNG